MNYNTTLWLGGSVRCPRGLSNSHSICRLYLYMFHCVCFRTTRLAPGSPATSIPENSYVQNWSLAWRRQLLLRWLAGVHFLNSSRKCSSQVVISAKTVYIRIKVWTNCCNPSYYCFAAFVNVQTRTCSVWWAWLWIARSYLALVVLDLRSTSIGLRSKRHYISAHSGSPSFLTGLDAGSLPL